MLVIIAIFITMIFTIEMSSIMLSFKKNNDVNVVKKLNKTVKTDNDKFNCYSVSKDKKINLKPGKIYIKDLCNIFINYDNNLMLMEKDIVYTMTDNFSLEIINVSGKENIKYYYVSI
tara:strand:+ start:10802 stop:11152 length:351 start_codon:yes stop_codon:yes gene_type:complete